MMKQVLSKEQKAAATEMAEIWIADNNEHDVFVTDELVSVMVSDGVDRDIAERASFLACKGIEAIGRGAQAMGTKDGITDANFVVELQDRAIWCLERINGAAKQRWEGVNGRKGRVDALKEILGDSDAAVEFFTSEISRLQNQQTTEIAVPDSANPELN